MEFRLLKAHEIDCRIGMVKENGLTLLLYKDARVDMNILDETVGPMNWQKSYSRDNRNCTVSIWDDAKAQWISKEDTGTESNTEAEKGLASDSFKRACFNWGIGRELYSAPFTWIPADKCNIKDKKCYDTFKVSHIGYTGREINELQIVNARTGDLVFKMGGKIEPRQEVKQEETGALDKASLQILQDKIKADGIDVAKFCTAYKKDRLSELTQKEYANAIKHWEKVIENCR